MVGAIDSRAVMLLLITVMEWLIQNNLRLANQSYRNTKKLLFVHGALYQRQK